MPITLIMRSMIRSPVNKARNQDKKTTHQFLADYGFVGGRGNPDPGLSGKIRNINLVKQYHNPDMLSFIHEVINVSKFKYQKRISP
jgi:hypothetical protein